MALSEVLQFDFYSDAVKYHISPRVAYRSDDALNGKNTCESREIPNSSYFVKLQCYDQPWVFARYKLAIDKDRAHRNRWIEGFYTL